MPVRELRCDTEICVNHGITFEWFARSMDKPDPNCPKCGAQMSRLMSTFATPFQGPLSKYKEPGKEHFQESRNGGHYVWRNKSSRLPDGGPEKCLINSRSEQREYCKAEGLIMPDEINPNSEISPDGKTLYTSGMKGQWATGLPADEIRNTGNPWLEE